MDQSLSNTVNPEAGDHSRQFTQYSLLKRYGFLLSWVPSLLLILSGWVTQTTGEGAWLWSLVIAAFIGIPIADQVVGRDNTNPAESAQEALIDDRYYVRIMYISVLLHWSAFVFMAWVISTLDTSWFYLLGGMLSAGVSNGFSIVAGHEMGHKVMDSRQSLAARVLLACSGFGQYTLHHNADHHNWVATPGDHSSARMGESIYRFFPREVIGTLRSTWALEKSRLARKGKSVWSLANKTLQSALLTLVSYTTLIVLFGAIMIPYLAIASLFAWWLLSSASYVEHYGLLRQKDSDGNYESCKVGHAWNSNYLVSNLITLQVQRHSDHHLRPSVPYQVLKIDSSMPMLPQGYPSMFLLAAVPPLWFAVIDPLLLKWVGHDLDKINIDPKNRRRLIEKYSSPAR
ncbi:MAG: alkane 1-monooxygenase [Acidiferrobacterales bacterium]